MRITSATPTPYDKQHACLDHRFWLKTFNAETSSRRNICIFFFTDIVQIVYVIFLLYDWRYLTTLKIQFYEIFPIHPKLKKKKLQHF